jgi:hypothetical protein
VTDPRDKAPRTLTHEEFLREWEALRELPDDGSPDEIEFPPLAIADPPFDVEDD